MKSAPDTAGVIAPPPLLALVALVGGLILDWLAPLGSLAALPAYMRYALAVLLLALAVFVSLRAIRAFARVGTEVKPWRPSTVIVTEDVFARTRNPMYWGLGLAIAGLAMGLASDWSLVALVPFAFVIHFGVVLREEKYLEAKFGDEYRRYRAAVPRYGWRF